MFGGTSLGGLDLGVDTDEVIEWRGVMMVFSDVCLLLLLFCCADSGGMEGLMSVIEGFSIFMICFPLFCLFSS